MEAAGEDLYTEAAFSLKEDSHKSKERAQERGQEKSRQTSHFTPSKKVFISVESTKHKRPGKCLHLHSPACS